MLVGISYYINSIIMTKYIQEISVFENLKCKYKKLNLIFNHLVAKNFDQINATTPNWCRWNSYVTTGFDRHNALICSF